MNSVANSTMAISTLILLLATGILAVSAECQKDNALIEYCFSFGFNNTAFSKKRPGVYTMMNLCGTQYNDAKVYCDTCSGGGGWLVV